MEENAYKLHFIACNFVIHKQILIFSVASFSPKIFHVTVLLLVYFYDQFVALEIHNSRHRYSV